jgi:hypothetical protein
MGAQSMPGARHVHATCYSGVWQGRHGVVLSPRCGDWWARRNLEVRKLETVPCIDVISLTGLTHFGGFAFAEQAGQGPFLSMEAVSV